MRYYKEISDNYLISIGTGSGHEEITSEEYSQIMSVIRSKPSAEEGYDYRLKADLTWELVEVPVIDEGDEEVTSKEFLYMVEEVL